MTDDENHYTELQGVYKELIDRHEYVKNTLHDPPNCLLSEDIQKMEGRKEGLLESISEIEDLLNEWHDRDDRDGD